MARPEPATVRVGVHEFMEKTALDASRVVVVVVEAFKFREIIARLRIDRTN